MIEFLDSLFDEEEILKTYLADIGACEWAEGFVEGFAKGYAKEYARITAKVFGKDYTEEYTRRLIEGRELGILAYINRIMDEGHSMGIAFYRLDIPEADRKRYEEIIKRQRNERQQNKSE